MKKLIEEVQVIHIGLLGTLWLDIQKWRAVGIIIAFAELVSAVGVCVFWAAIGMPRPSTTEAGAQ